MTFHVYKKPADMLKETGAKKKWQVGDKVKTTLVHTCRYGYMTPGTEVEVIGANVKEDGAITYDIQDKQGNRIYNVGNVI